MPNREVHCRLVLSDERWRPNCDECIADAALGWIPVGKMTEIGKRGCQGLCTCEIQFEDETDEEFNRELTPGDIKRAMELAKKIDPELYELAMGFSTFWPTKPTESTDSIKKL